MSTEKEANCISQNSKATQPKLVWSEAAGEVTKEMDCQWKNWGLVNGVSNRVIENSWASCIKHAGNLQRDYLK
jgi:hypothetical protein